MSGRKPAEYKAGALERKDKEVASIIQRMRPRVENCLVSVWTFVSVAS